MHHWFDERYSKVEQRVAAWSQSDVLNAKTGYPSDWDPAWLDSSWRPPNIPKLCMSGHLLCTCAVATAGSESYRWRSKFAWVNPPPGMSFANPDGGGCSNEGRDVAHWRLHGRVFTWKSAPDYIPLGGMAKKRQRTKRTTPLRGFIGVRLRRARTISNFAASNLLWWAVMWFQVSENMPLHSGTPQIYITPDLSLAKELQILVFITRTNPLFYNSPWPRHSVPRLPLQLLRRSPSNLPSSSIKLSKASRLATKWSESFVKN